MKVSILAAAALAATMAAAPALAQNANVNANNLVNVNISNVANDLARDLKVNVQDLIDIGSVQVPVGVAANVCNVAANVLAQQKNSPQGAACDATTTSQALNQIVQRQLNAG